MDRSGDGEQVKEDQLRRILAEPVLGNEIFTGEGMVDESNRINIRLHPNFESTQFLILPVHCPPSPFRLGAGGRSVGPGDDEGEGSGGRKSAGRGRDDRLPGQPSQDTGQPGGKMGGGGRVTAASSNDAGEALAEQE